MAQTTTLLAQGATRLSEPRLSSPCASRASIYFISPARPAAIQAGKCLSSAVSAAGAMPARSNPASLAARWTTDFMSEVEVTQTRLNRLRQDLGGAENFVLICPRLEAQLLDFLVVILAVEDIPLL